MLRRAQPARHDLDSAPRSAGSSRARDRRARSPRVQVAALIVGLVAWPSHESNPDNDQDIDQNEVLPTASAGYIHQLTQMSSAVLVDSLSTRAGRESALVFGSTTNVGSPPGRRRVLTHEPEKNFPPPPPPPPHPLNRKFECRPDCSCASRAARTDAPGAAHEYCRYHRRSSPRTSSRRCDVGPTRTRLDVPQERACGRRLKSIQVAREARVFAHPVALVHQSATRRRSRTLEGRGRARTGRRPCARDPHFARGALDVAASSTPEHAKNHPGLQWHSRTSPGWGRTTARRFRGPRARYGRKQSAPRTMPQIGW